MKLPKHVLKMTAQDWADYGRSLPPPTQPVYTEPARTNKVPAHLLQPVSLTESQWAAKAASARARREAEARFQEMVNSDKDFWHSDYDA